MPTNLPPEALEAEDRYRAAQTTAEKITALEAYISKIPKHKGTDKLRADLRRKLSQLKESAQAQKKQGGRQESVFVIEREGAGQVAIVGPPNVGKSALVRALTNAEPEVAPFPFTTWTPLPGIMPVNNVQIQLIDTPPLNPDHVDPQLLELIKRADLLLLMLDLQGLTLNQFEEATALLEQYRIVLTPQATAVDQPRVWRPPYIIVANKNDDAGTDDDFAVLCELLGEEWHLLPASATTGRHLEQLKQAIFDQLDIIRVYTKPPSEDPDFSAPFVLPRGSTVEAFAAKVHRDFVTQLKSARVWGTGVYDGQPVGRDHVLHDGDVVELRI